MTVAKLPGSSLKGEWRIFALLILLAAALLGYLNGIGQPDRFVYDNLVRLTQRPATSNIVIVAIDDFSIAGLGRWPWPRRTHARLLDILTDSDAKAVGLDVILSEPEKQGDGEDDTLLAAALARNGRTVLPVLIERGANGLTTTLPLPAFADVAKGMGYIHFQFEDDGVVRSAYLRESLYGVWWSQFALAVYHVGEPPRADADPFGVLTPSRPAANTSFMDSIWKRDHLERIPFAGPAGHFQTVSYVDVLSGRVPEAFFKNKYVLVGATAAGIATAFPTPLTSGYRAMSGTEVDANILAGLLENKNIHGAAPWQSALLAVIATLLALLACRYFSPVRALLATLTLVLMVVAVTYGAFLLEIWIPPAAAILTVLAVYPLWSWRRLEAALGYLNEEFARLNQNAPMILRGRDKSVEPNHADFLDRRIASMRLAADRSRDMHQFVVDNLNSMPDATLVLSEQCELLMHNHAATDYFTSLGMRRFTVPTLDELFAKLEHPLDEHGRATTWRHLLFGNPSSGAVERETRDINGKELLIKSAPSGVAGGAMLGWIVSLIDVSSLRAAERHRDESLHFISHDMRAPQSSILALLELQKSPGTAFPLEDFYARIEKSVHTTLTLADDFVHLAQADSQAYQLQEADFPSLLADAADDMWAFARSRRIEIVIDAEIDDHWVNVDRRLMVRALGNLLSNAIKFSPQGSKIQCTATVVENEGEKRIACSVRDRGMGIPDAERKRIFSRFARLNRNGRDSVGLGLVFVKTVIERHGGSIDFISEVGRGTTFMLTLPCIPDNEQAERDASAAHAASNRE
jgi:CHASE2 domain-containing sensor protein/signal transduction histidine kinase